jgi:hypothetical protein
VKPISVIDYNKSMIGVDLKDQLLHSYLTGRKRMNKWYMKLFCRLLNTSILNAMIIYRSDTGKKIEQLSFRIELTVGLCEICKCCRTQSAASTLARQCSATSNRHFISKIPPTEKKSRPQKRCVVSEEQEEERHCVLV